MNRQAIEPPTKRKRTPVPRDPSSNSSLPTDSPSTIEATLRSLLAPSLPIPSPSPHLIEKGSFTPSTFRRPPGQPARRLPPPPPRLVAPPPLPPQASSPLPQDDARTSIPPPSPIAPDIDAATTPEPVIRPFGSVYLRLPVVGMEACDEIDEDHTPALLRGALKFRRAGGKERLDAHSQVGRVFRKARLRRSRDQVKLRQKCSRQSEDGMMERRYSSSTNASARPSTPKSDVGYGMEWKTQTSPSRNGPEFNRMVWSAENSPIEAVP